MSGTVYPPPHLFTEMLLGLRARYPSSRVCIHVCDMVQLQSSHWIGFPYMYIVYKNLHKLKDRFQASLFNYHWVFFAFFFSLAVVSGQMQRFLVPRFNFFIGQLSNKPPDWRLQATWVSVTRLPRVNFHQEAHLELKWVNVNVHISIIWPHNW